MFWVVYRGLGLWVPIIPVVCLLVVFVAEAALVVGPTHLFDDRQGGVLEGVDWYLPTAVSFFLAGAICFLWGLRVNRPLPIDPYTKMPGPPPNHSLYFVKMQYWGFLYIALGAYFLWRQPAGNSLAHTPRNAPYSARVPDTPPAAIEQSPQPPADDSPTRPLVDAAEQAKRILKQTPPVYPSLAKQARIQGEVRFDAIIGKDGSVRELTLVKGHPLLAPAAEQAVKQWVYRPAILDGKPVEVATQIDVNFALGRQ